ncbi:biotin--[acetyl-CoA-carboxylase] ligase [Rhodobacteraceae bacterium 2CG4]|uniref:biotin--[biotin carboxyl-carrier protein] ligase n=1 Tax=Halovulum marinum TaxID=2662447 RepID=A0A6L5YYL2_9RHOB|nr:biotin--[acetyl-CoA-carboxylase] ligase [Halovulum marinum]MSU88935.1 biotin--[acetyl-CoA-carboxylase] ligase [Halovulum marinum]
MLARTDSTNAEALRRLAAGEAAPFWVLADRQTAGRGRRGRPWVSPAGNFYGSVALRPGGDAGQAALRSFTAALALAETLDGLGLDPARLALKWPNDVLLDGRKLAGILLEGTSQRGALALVVGIGVNLASAPPPGAVEPGAVPPVALAEAGLRLTPDAFLDALAPRFAALEAEFAARGFEPIRAAWLARAARLGQQITARLPGRQITGRFETVDETGAVVLDTPAGRQHLPAADIHF